MADKEKVLRLIAEIESATADGRLKWAETADPDEFITVMSNGKFLIKALRFSRLDEEGDRVGPGSVEVIRREDDVLLMRIREDSDIGWGRLDKVFKEARDRALGVDAALDEILSELDDIPF